MSLYAAAWLNLCDDVTCHSTCLTPGHLLLLRRFAPLHRHASSHGDNMFQSTLLFRATFMERVTSVGVDVMMSHLDVVWVGDVVEHVFGQRDVDQMTVVSGGHASHYE